MVSMALFITLLVGCHQPTETYHKAVERLQITSKLTTLENKTEKLSRSLNSYITTEEYYLNYQEKIEDLNYQQIIIDIQELKGLLNELQSDSQQLEFFDRIVVEADENLKLALSNYSILISNMESAFIITNDLDQIFYDIQSLNKQVFELSFSGKPTSNQYKDALSEFLVSNKEILEILDLEKAEKLIKTTAIDANQLETIITNANLCNEKLLSITTYNETDEVTHKLIIQIYEQIINMFIYVLENKETIEWMNKHISLVTYYEEQNEVIANYLILWKESLK